MATFDAWQTAHRQGADDWAAISTATGPVTVKVTSAYVMSEVIKDRPYVGSTSATVSIAH